MTDSPRLERLKEIINGFLIYGDLEEIIPFGKGHINDTFWKKMN